MSVRSSHHDNVIVKAMELRRLLRMTVAEIAHRSRQGASKRLERSGVVAPTGRTRWLKGLPCDAPDPCRFFAGATDARTQELVERRAPEAGRGTVDGAQRIVTGRFDLLGYRGLTFGDPIDWHLDPVSGVRAPAVHWSRLDPLNRAQVGDSKVTWELNRHQWAVTLGQAYRLTGDESYSEAFAGYTRNWIEANPVGRGISWSSSLEAALRLISWLWAISLFQGSTALSSSLLADLTDGIAVHATRVERHLSRYFAPNTHLTGEALGLLYAGVLIPEARRARRWRELGMRILVEQSNRQISADGIYFEQSTCYQRYTAEIYLHALILAQRNGLSFPPAVATRVQALLDFLVWVRRPDGSMPMIGDADGGWLLPLCPRAPNDLRGVFSTAAAWFGRADYARAAGGVPAAETLWLLGPEGLDAFDALRASAPASSSSRLFREGGYAVMRGGWASDAHQLIFDVGPLGDLGHGHADLLSVQCAAFGEPYIVDAGTYAYSADPGWRDFFRGTSAHSTVTVDGRSQAAPAGPFKWKTRPATRVRDWASTEAFDLADAQHDAYRTLADPVVHRRRVRFEKPRFWVVADDLQGTGHHELALRFQFAPMAVAVDDPFPWTRARGSNERGSTGLLVRAFSAVPLTAEVREGDVDPPQGWVSPDYGKRSPAPVLIYSAATTLPLRILTLLLPVRDVTLQPPEVSSLLDDDGTPRGLRFEETGEEIRFDR